MCKTIKSYEVIGRTSCWKFVLFGSDIPYLLAPSVRERRCSFRQCGEYQIAEDTRGRLVMSLYDPASDGTLYFIDDSEAVPKRGGVVDDYHPHGARSAEEGRQSTCRI